MMMRKAIVCSIAFVTLTACGSINQNAPVTTLLDRVSAVLGKPEQKPAPAITPEILSAGSGNILVAKLVSRNALAALTRVARDDDTVTWQTPAGASLIFQDDILIGTRGLGDDLMGVDVTGTRAAIAAGGGTATRNHAFLGSEDQIRNRTADCTIAFDKTQEITTLAGTFNTRKYTETCTGRLALTNSYWVTDGQIVQSLQAISLGVGYVLLNPL